MFRARDLPSDRKQWDSIFRSIIGSPDPVNGRQLDGMGGGLSSLSKVCVIDESFDDKADVDYTFVAIGVRDDEVDYSSNCGNMSSAVGPYAVDAGIVNVKAESDDITVRIRNTNTGKYINSTFPLDEDGKAASYGDFAIDGVAGTAAKIQLSFLDPSGSKTGKLLPTGQPLDVFDGVQATCIDVGNPCVFVGAESVGITADIDPDTLAVDTASLARLDSIRRQAGVRMGLAANVSKVPGSVPKIAMLSTPETGIDGKRHSDIVVRALSVGQPHKAIPITVAMAVAAATRVEGSTAHKAIIAASGISPDPDGVTIAHPTGKILVSSKTDDSSGDINEASVFRTARRLMSGEIYVK